MAKKNQNNAAPGETVSKKTSVRNEPTNGKESKRKAGKISFHGFSEKELVDVLKKMIRSRMIDDKAMRLLKQGKTFFHIAAAGHEAVQIAIGMQMDSQKDWFFPYYRDLGIALMAGVTPKKFSSVHSPKQMILQAEEDNFRFIGE